MNQLLPFALIINKKFVDRLSPRLYNMNIRQEAICYGDLQSNRGMKMLLDMLAKEIVGIAIRLEFSPPGMRIACQPQRVASARRQKEEDFTVNSEPSMAQGICNESCQNEFVEKTRKDASVRHMRHILPKKARHLAHPCASEALVIALLPHSLSPFALRLSPALLSSGRCVMMRHNASCPCATAGYKER
jgi:hypothetical protein